jgi:hypothetical protein
MDSEEKKEQTRYLTKSAVEIKSQEKIISEVDQLRKKRGMKGVVLGKEVKNNSLNLKTIRTTRDGYPFDLSNSKSVHVEG